MKYSSLLIYKALTFHTQKSFHRNVIAYRRAPYFKGYKFHEWKARENNFYESTLVPSLQPAICVTIKFLLIFGETNFVQVPKIHEIGSPGKKAPYGIYIKQ